MTKEEQRLAGAAVGLHPWRDRHMVSVRVHLRDAMVCFYPWRREKTWAQPKDWRAPRVAWLERARLVAL